MFARKSGARRLLGAVFAVAALVLSAGSSVAAEGCRDVGMALRHAKEARIIESSPVEAFYEAYGPGCAWNDQNAQALMSALDAAGSHGLDPALFHINAIDPASTPGDEADAAARDVLLTDAALKYATALSQGLSGERTRNKDLAYSRANREHIEGLIDALFQGQVPAWFSSLHPKADGYSGLQAALQKYQAIAESGGFAIMPDNLVLKSKRKYRDYALLRQRLAMEGDIAFDSGVNRYDDELYQGIVRFQERNGLRANGRVTWKTLERLNISAGERVAQINLNLERLRMDEAETPATRVEVNIPAATAVLYRDGVPHLAMNAVVGAVEHETPTLSSAIDTVILNPTWTIPESIIENEIKPAMKRQKNYLRKNRMYWSGDQLIQEPGPHNSLGRIKFDFPNRYSVYLHDTPAKGLFLSPDRAQSHGCVRLEKPLDLAAELLRDSPRWDREALQAGIDDGKTRRIAVPEPMPVVIVYRTAFVGGDGAVNFRPDVYGWDTKLTLSLSERAGALR